MAGQTQSKKKVTFKFYEPEAASVFVAGTFNDWNPEGKPLKKQRDGSWQASATLSPGDYEYRFVVDGEWRDDPECADRKRNDHGGENCIIKVQ